MATQMQGQPLERLPILECDTDKPTPTEYDITDPNVAAMFTGPDFAPRSKPAEPPKRGPASSAPGHSGTMVHAAPPAKAEPPARDVWWAFKLARTADVLRKRQEMISVPGSANAVFKTSMVHVKERHFYTLLCRDHDEMAAWAAAIVGMV